MAPPAPKSCYMPDCEYATTTGLPTYDLVLRDLELHTRYAHPQIPSQSVQGGGHTNEPKPDRLPRPTIGEGVTEADWMHFVDKWSRYKRSTLSNATPQHISDQLWACCDSDLETSVSIVSMVSMVSIVKVMKQLFLVQ